MPASPSSLAPSTFSRSSFLLLLLVLAACTGDNAGSNDGAADTTGMGAAAEAFRAQKASIDSFVANAKPIESVVAELGTIYRIADDSLAAIVRRESAKTYDCYTSARTQHDPFLAGVAHVLVNFGAAGWDIVRVERHEFSSAAGGAVVACINARAKSEWVLPTRGIKPGAHLVRLTFKPDSAPGRN